MIKDIFHIYHTQNLDIKTFWYNLPVGVKLAFYYTRQRMRVYVNEQTTILKCL